MVAFNVIYHCLQQLDEFQIEILRNCLHLKREGVTLSGALKQFYFTSQILGSKMAAKINFLMKKGT